MGRVLEITSRSEVDTLSLARTLAPRFSRGDLIVLSGELGTGKSVFVRGLAEGLHIDPSRVNSPSYTIVNEYPGDPALYHLDLYRIKSPDELYEAGWDDLLLRGGIVAVEWGERAERNLPDSYYLITFVRAGETERTITVSHIGGTQES